MLTQACSSCNGNLTVLPSGTDARPPETYQARRPISGFRGLEDYGSSMVVPRHGGSHKRHGPRTSRLDLGLLRVSDLGFKVYRASHFTRLGFRIQGQGSPGGRPRGDLSGGFNETARSDCKAFWILGSLGFFGFWDCGLGSKVFGQMGLMLQAELAYSMKYCDECNIH